MNRSFGRMDPVSMDLDLIRMPRRKEPINLITGVFLKSVYFLNDDKCIVTGLFKNRGDSLGVVFKGKKGVVFWSYNIFTQFAVDFNKVTVSLENKEKFYVKSGSGEDIKVNKIFGTMYVFLYDGEHTLTLNAEEWTQFVNNLPLIYREVNALFMNENILKIYIGELIEGKENNPPNDLLVADRLFDEVELYKYNGGGS